MKFQTLWMGAACAAVVALAGAQSAHASLFYGVRFGGQLIQVDTTAQTVTTVSTLHVGATNLDSMEELEFDGAGNLYAVRGYNDGNFPPTNFNQVYKITNPALGNSLLSANLDNSTAKRHSNLAYRSSDGLFYSNRNSDGHLGTLNVTTGAFADGGVYNGGRFTIEALAINPVTGNAYGLVDNGLAIFGIIDYALISMDLNTGLSSVIGSLNQGSEQFKSLRFDSEGNAYTVGYTNGNVYSVNLTSGAATFEFAGGANGIGTTGLAYIVPAPASAALVGGGLLAMGRRRRNRR